MNSFDYEMFVAQNPWAVIGVLSAVVLAITLKGFALWRAARNNSSGWFVALLLVNTLGILELLYLAVWGRNKK
jgi:hypothetical protein